MVSPHNSSTVAKLELMNSVMCWLNTVINSYDILYIFKLIILVQLDKTTIITFACMMEHMHA